MFPQSRCLSKILVIVSVYSLASITDAEPIQIVAPGGLEEVDGNDTGFAPTQPTRVQYLYDSAFFEALTGSRDITAVALRPDQGTGAFTSTDDNVTVRLSTTQVNGLSSIFSENVGGDETLVYDGPLTIEANAREVPRSFSLVVNFDDPFRYDRDQGDLLVDITFSGFDDPWIIDNQSFSDGETRLIVGGAGSTAARNIWPILTPMQFTFAPVVEQVTGDFDGDGVVSIADLDVMTLGDPAFDVTGDGATDRIDLETMVHDLVGTWIGDSDGDGTYSSSDLVSVLAAGRYEAGPTAKWSQGDWNLDGQFDSVDLVVSLADGGYEQGPRAAVNAVPEPSGLVMMVAGFLGLLQTRSRQLI